MNKGDRARLIDRDRLREVAMTCHHGKYVILTKPLDAYEKQERYGRLKGESAWWVHFDTEPCGNYTSGAFYVPTSCLDTTSTPTPAYYGDCGTPTTQTITIKQKENLNMYVYTVRALQIPNNLAQQAGEKEKIVIPATDVVAENEYAAAAIVGAENADVIKSVQESKGSLRLTIKSTGC